MVGILAMMGCVYKAPLAPKQNIKIDNAVLGAWQATDAAAGIADKLVVLEYTDTEYLVCYQGDKINMYFRGYPVKVEGISCVQLQLIGTADGVVKKEERKFNVLSYTASKDAIEIRLLNNEIIDAELATTEELQAAFAKNKDNAKLFGDAVKFTRVKAAK